MSSRKGSRNKGNRIPLPADGIQVNFCKTIGCPNFRVVPKDHVGRGKHAKVRDNYRRIGTRPARKSKPKVHLWCSLCGATTMLYSNQAIAEQLSFLEDQCRALPELHCPYCASEREAVRAGRQGQNLQKFGTTKAGSRRYRCRDCGKTFSVSRKATLRQRQPETNELILELLVNKVPMRRICRIAKIRPAVLYNRIHFFRQQCCRFAAIHEQILRAGRLFKLLEIAVDQQGHVLNWSSQLDRRNTQLYVVASADNRSGYVFGTQLNHDPRFDAFDLDLEARESGDYELDHSFRRFARFHLPGETESESSMEGMLGVESHGRSRTPAGGVLVRATYLIFGHMFYLRRLLPGVETFRLYLDQDPAFRGAFLAAFGDLVAAGNADALWVAIDKRMTVDEKRPALARAEQQFKKFQANSRFEDRVKAARALLVEAYTSARKRAPEDRLHWVDHPWPHMGEPRKRVCLLTGREGQSLGEVGELMLWASLHAVDRFFMQIRRSISLLERPIQTASASGRTWHGYSAYNPQIVASLVDIYRVIYNYSLTGQDGNTPAMRLGIAEKAVSLEQILDFV